MKLIVKFFYLLAGAVILTSPASGFDFINKSKEHFASAVFPDTVVYQLGNLAYSKIARNSKVLKDSEKTKLVNQVISKLIRAAEAGEYAEVAGAFEWETTIIDDSRIVNTKVFPGGKIIVYSGLFNLTEYGDAQNHHSNLATVLGHEMGHALALHAAERLDNHTRAAIMSAMTGIELNTSGLDMETTIAVMGAMGAGYAGGMAPPFQRQQETEADKIGIELMAKAGYDPNSAISFLQNFYDKTSPTNSVELFANHPDPKTRIDDLQKVIAQLKK